MSTDPWQMWRELTLQASPLWAGRGAAPGAAAPGASPAMVFERFAEAARSYFAQRAAAGTDAGAQAGAAAAADAARGFGDRLRESLEQGWPLLQAFFVPPGASMAPGGAGAPALGPLREHQQRLERGMRALAQAEEAQQRLQRLWSDVLREAALAFAAKLGSGPADGSAEALQSLYDTWIDCAEQAYARSAHSPEFSQALADLVNALSACRAEWRAGYECWARSLDLPTRSEVNTLNARIAALESSLRQVGRTIEAPAARGAKGGSSAKPAKRSSPDRRRRPR